MTRYIKPVTIILAVVFSSAILFGSLTATNKNDKQEKSLTPLPAGYEVKSLNMPTNVTFANEEVPVSRFDIYERLDRELLSNTYFHSNTILLIKRANRYFPIIEPVLAKHGIPDDFKFIAMIESGFQPRAKSPAGAAGIWQFLKGTGKEYHMEINTYVDERYNIDIATEAACLYFKKAYEKFGSWSLVAASYNYGMNGVSRAQEKQKVENYYDLLLPEETQRYVFRAIAMKEIMKNPSSYGFKVKTEDLYPPIAYRKRVVTTGITNITDYAIQQGTNYYLLKEFNPWLRDNYLTNRSRKRYVIKIPKTSALIQERNKIVPHNKNWVIDE